MDAVHLHLLLNHVPVLGAFFALLTFAVAWPTRGRDLAKFGLAFLVINAVAAIPVYFSGEPAEETIERLPGVSKQYIEQHEDAALVAFVMVVGLGVFGLVSLAMLWKRATVPRWIVGTGAAACMIVGGVMAWTANLGGQIRHSELHSGSQNATVIERNATGDSHDD